MQKKQWEKKTAKGSLGSSRYRQRVLALDNCSVTDRLSLWRRTKAIWSQMVLGRGPCPQNRFHGNQHIKNVSLLYTLQSMGNADFCVLGILFSCLSLGPVQGHTSSLIWGIGCPGSRRKTMTIISQCLRGTSQQYKWNQGVHLRTDVILRIFTHAHAGNTTQISNTHVQQSDLRHWPYWGTVQEKQVTEGKYLSDWRVRQGTGWDIAGKCALWHPNK